MSETRIPVDGERPYDVVVCHQPWTQGLFGPVVQEAGLAYVAYFHGPATDGWVEWLAARTRPDLVIAPSAHSLATTRTVFAGVPRQVSSGRRVRSFTPFCGRRRKVRYTCGTATEVDRFLAVEAGVLAGVGGSAAPGRDGAVGA